MGASGAIAPQIKPPPRERGLGVGETKSHWLEVLYQVFLGPVVWCCQKKRPALIMRPICARAQLYRHACSPPGFQAKA